MNERISNGQLLLAMIVVVVPFGHFVFVYLVIQHAGRDGWICLFAAGLTALATVFLQFRTAAGHPDQSLIEYGKAVFGQWAGTLVGLIVILYFLLVSALTIHVLDVFLGMIYRKTPTVVFTLLVTILVAWVVHNGLEVMFRVYQFLLPGLILLGVSAMVLTLKDKHPANLLPVLQHGLGPLTHAWLVFVAMFCELVIFGMLIPYGEHPHRITREGLIMVGVLVVMFLGPVTGPIMVFGEPLARSILYPTYAEITYIEYENVLERLDIIGILLWTIGSYLRSTAFCFAAAHGIATLFGARNCKRFAVPVACLAGVAAALMDLSVAREDTYDFLDHWYLIIVIAVGVGIPLFLAITARLRSVLVKGTKT